MNLFKEHKIVTVAVLLGVVGSAIGLGIINQPVEYQPSDLSYMTVESTKTTIKPKVEEVEEADATVVPQEVAPKPIAVEVIEEPVQPATVADEDMYNLVMGTIRESGFERWVTISQINVFKMIQHHTLGSATRYTKPQIIDMTHKCLAFIENNKQAYSDKYTTMASQKMALDAQNTPCWLI